MTPAEELRAAATKLREMASKATNSRKVEYGWSYVDREDMKDPGEYTHITNTGFGGDDLVAETVAWGDAAWIALMGPDKAELLAAWLEAEADCQDAIAEDVGSQILARVLDAIAGREVGAELTTSFDTSPKALAFARAVLGSPA